MARSALQIKRPMISEKNLISDICWIIFGTTEILHCISPSGRIMALGSTQTSNINKNQSYLPEGKWSRSVGLTTPTYTFVDCL